MKNFILANSQVDSCHAATLVELAHGELLAHGLQEKKKDAHQMLLHYMMVKSLSSITTRHN